jgi:hypothetical protein
VIDWKAGLLLLVMVSSIAGCVKPACLDCDDGNPCTQDQCREGECANTPLNGPVEGCYGVGGCIEYSCFSGECLPQKIMRCCGNGACDMGESYETCPSDCQSTCYDGIKNHGEQGIDCGGPCSPCESQELNGIQRINAVRQLWRQSVENYTNAIGRFNADKNATRLRGAAIASYSETENILAVIERMNMSSQFMNLTVRLNSSVSTYMRGVHMMVLFCDTQKDRYRVSSNGLFSQSLEEDRTFVQEYNGLIDRYNGKQVGCANHLLDAGEESTDCGGICNKDCAMTLNITKHVTVHIEGGPATITLNVSAPAMDLPPEQRVLASYYNPKPDYVETSLDGDEYVVYEVSMPYYGSNEMDITRTLRLYRTSAFNVTVNDYFDKSYTRANNLSQLSEEICYRSGLLRKESQTTRGRVEKIQRWLIDNVKYQRNDETLGAQLTYDTRVGACDEHADLFNSMTRCVGIPSRRVTGYMLNASKLEGHAWAQYYDGGWYFIDPSAKNLEQAFVPENKHITSCIGEGAYNCGLGYTYTYAGSKPKIDVKEIVYIN